jgi:hypothetical protein
MEFPESTRCFLISALGCFVMGSGVSATASNQFDFYNFLGNQPIAGIPSGTYSDWTEDQRREALKLIKLACVRASFAGMMAVSNQNATEVQKTEEIRTLTATCIANHLPKDHPARGDYQGEALKRYQAAKSLGSDFSPPHFEGDSGTASR